MQGDFVQDQRKVYRGRVFDWQPDHTLGDPIKYRYFKDGALVVDGRKIVKASDFSSLTPDESKLPCSNFGDALIMPGFVDTHAHYPQTMILGSYGKKLLEWLEKYTFPEEMKFSNPIYAAQIADIFIKQAFANGTTAIQSFSTIHKASVDAICEKADSFGMRLITGKVMMDTNAPKDLLQQADSCYEDCKEGIEKWHGKNRISYAVTPRFALTSTEKQLRLAKKLLSQYDGLYFQTHLAENKSEIAAVMQFHPQYKNYLDVYFKNDLLSSRSTLAHSIYLSKTEWKNLKNSKASISFCPSSNLFLGSGLFSYQDALDRGISVGLGLDIGAGTSFSMFKNMLAAYQVLHLQSVDLCPSEAFFMATLGGAISLGLELEIGSFRPGACADFIVIDSSVTDFMAKRMEYCNTIEEELFLLMAKGDERNIAHTFVGGTKVF